MAQIPGYMVCAKAQLSRSRLSDIERGLVKPDLDEMERIHEALDSLIEARRKVQRYAADCGWPFTAT
jgi:transcriptional regulator with XRE-family HTH domain